MIIEDVKQRLNQVTHVKLGINNFQILMTIKAIDATGMRVTILVEVVNAHTMQMNVVGEK